MANRTFNIPKSKGKSFKTIDAIDVAARYFVYKLYEATGRQPLQWVALHGLGESAATISRAVERGWVILQDVRGKPLDRKVALTDEGRRLTPWGSIVVQRNRVPMMRRSRKAGAMPSITTQRRH
jgi:hypothetical protein